MSTDVKPRRPTAASGWPAPDRGPCRPRWHRCWPAAGIAASSGGFAPVAALLALVVSLALQVGVNYANDYSDGIRGTDAERVGPLRLVGSGLADPAAVQARRLRPASRSPRLAGLVLVVLTGLWWLLAVGAACVLAAWFYTGAATRTATAGWARSSCSSSSAWWRSAAPSTSRSGRVPRPSWLAGVAIGTLACALLVVNNLRDIAGDTRAGKRTLATRIGDRATR